MCETGAEKRPASGGGKRMSDWVSIENWPDARGLERRQRLRAPHKEGRASSPPASSRSQKCPSTGRRRRKASAPWPSLSRCIPPRCRSRFPRRRAAEDHRSTPEWRASASRRNLPLNPGGFHDANRRNPPRRFHADPVLRTGAGAGFAGGESEAGQSSSTNACRTCHTVTEGDNRLGPHLHGVSAASRLAARLRLFGAMTGSGIVWDAAISTVSSKTRRRWCRATT